MTVAPLQVSDSLPKQRHYQMHHCATFNWMDLLSLNVLYPDIELQVIYYSISCILDITHGFKKMQNILKY